MLTSTKGRSTWHGKRFDLQRKTLPCSMCHLGKDRCAARRRAVGDALKSAVRVEAAARLLQPKARVPRFAVPGQSPKGGQQDFAAITHAYEVAQKPSALYGCGDGLSTSCWARWEGADQSWRTTRSL